MRVTNNARDPRKDPRPGDVVRSGTRFDETNTGYRAKVLQVSQPSHDGTRELRCLFKDCEWTMSTCQWIEWMSDAEVLHVAD